MGDYFSQIMQGQGQDPITGSVPITNTPMPTLVGPALPQNVRPAFGQNFRDLNAIPPSVGPNGEQFNIMPNKSQALVDQNASPNGGNPNPSFVRPARTMPKGQSLSRTLMEFGLATMGAGSQPGMTTMGALAQGGVAAFQGMDNRRQIEIANARDERHMQHQLTRDDLQFKRQQARDVAERDFRSKEGAMTREANLRHTAMLAARRGLGAETLNDKRTLELAMSMNSDSDGKNVDWRGVHDTLSDIERGVPISVLAESRASLGGRPGRQVDDLTAMDLADAVTNARAGWISTDSSDFSTTGGSRELFTNQMEAAIKNGDRETADRLIGNDANARKILDAHFGPQLNPGQSQSATMTQAPRGGAAGGEASSPAPLPASREALEVGQWYQTNRGPRQFRGWEGDAGVWGTPGEGASMADPEKIIDQGKASGLPK